MHEIDIMEYDIKGISSAINEIRRNSVAPFWHNYYGINAEGAIFAVRKNKAIVFWHQDGSLIRGYFFSADIDALRELLQFLPQGAILDYVTRAKNQELHRTLEQSGIKQLYEMHRMSEAGITAEKRILLDAKLQKMHRLYAAERVRLATMADVELIYQKLYQVFDVRMGHLPTMDKLREFVDNGWVIVYTEDDVLCGLYIFIVQKGGTHYGYQIWNGAGPVGYFSLREKAREVYQNYLLEHGYNPEKVPAAYSWVDANNTQAVSVIEWRGGSFDGLYDFVYEKL